MGIIIMSFLSIGCINSLKKLIENSNIPKGNKIIITSHNYSLNSNNISHNTKVSKDIMSLEEIRKIIPDNELIIINQGSKINNFNVSRGTGIRVTKDGIVEPNKYDDTFKKEEEELVNIILNYPLFFQFIVDNAKTTPLRTDKEGNQFYASFLHDVKALYLQQNHIELIENKILIPYKIWQNDGLYTDYKSEEGSIYMGVNYLVNTEKLHEYNEGFNKWLNDVLSGNEFIVQIDGISTDPFFGYKSSDGVYHTDIAQDFDDACVLWLFENCTLPTKQKIPLIVSDEYVVFNEETQYYEGIRTKAIKANFSKFDIIDAVVSHTEGYDPESLTDWNKARFIETTDGPVIGPNAVSHYSSFFGIYQRYGNNVAILPEDRIKNGFQKDQVVYNLTQLKNNHLFNITKDQIKAVLYDLSCTIVRNAVNRGGTPCASPGQTGYKYPNKPYSIEDSMSKHHQFIIINDLSYWWSNCAFFGEGPGKYGIEGSLILCYKLREIANLWAIKHNITNPIFCFHEHPNNSLPSLHLHLLDGDNLNEIPWEEHSYKNVSLDEIIGRLEMKLVPKSKSLWTNIIDNWMPITVVGLSGFLFYTLE